MSRAAKRIDGVECTKEPVVLDEIFIERKNYRCFFAQTLKENISVYDFFSTIKN